MKKKDKYKIINYAIDEYGKKFNNDYQRVNISKKKLENWLSQYKHSYMCEWYYCCMGIYQNCWQEPIFEGNWRMTQKRVDEIILSIIQKLHKNYKRDNRVGICKNGDEIEIVIVARDLPDFRVDYLICLTNKEEE